MPMEYLEAAYDEIEEGGAVMVTEGTYTGSKMGSFNYGISKSMQLECVLGDECVVDGQDDHRCLYIVSVNGADERVTIKRIKLINGNADASVSADSN